MGSFITSCPCYETKFGFIAEKIELVDDCITWQGYLQLTQLEAEDLDDGDDEDLWVTLTSMGFNKGLVLDQVTCVFKFCVQFVIVRWYRNIFYTIRNNEVVLHCERKHQTLQGLYCLPIDNSLGNLYAQLVV